MEEKKTLSIDDFTFLFMATLADNPKIFDMRNRDNKIACLPVNYKQIIENILCAENGWKEIFSVLIDPNEYFDDHFEWEKKLARSIKKFLCDMNKSYEYDIEYDRILIPFTQQEIDLIMSRYSDEKLKDIMNHFTSLVNDYIYTREFQERFYDYSASSVRKMHDMMETNVAEKKPFSISKEHPRKIKSLFSKNNLKII